MLSESSLFSHINQLIAKANVKEVLSNIIIPDYCHLQKSMIYSKHQQKLIL